MQRMMLPAQRIIPFGYKWQAWKEGASGGNSLTGDPERYVNPLAYTAGCETV